MKKSQSRSSTGVKAWKVKPAGFPIKAGGVMKSHPRKESLEARMGYQGFHGEISVENSKRRHMFSCMSGDFKFFERILSARKPADPTFISKSAARNR